MTLPGCLLFQGQQSPYPWCPSRQPNDFTSALCHQPLAHTQAWASFWEFLNNLFKNALYHQNYNNSPMCVTFLMPKYAQQKMCKSLLNLSFISEGLKMRLCSRMLPCMFSPFSLSCINAYDACWRLPTHMVHMVHLDLLFCQTLVYMPTLHQQAQ